MESNFTEDVKLDELLRNVPVVMLTTIEPNGNLNSRPMAAPHFDGESEMWFLTLEHSAKVEDVRRFPQVNVSFVSPQENRYVSVRGRAQVVNDPIKRAEIWCSAHKSWFPKGLEDPDLTLLKVVIDRAESWNSNSSFFVQLIDATTQQGATPPKASEVTLEKKLH